MAFSRKASSSSHVRGGQETQEYRLHSYYGNKERNGLCRSLWEGSDCVTFDVTWRCKEKGKKELQSFLSQRFKISFQEEILNLIIFLVGFLFSCYASVLVMCIMSIIESINVGEQEEMGKVVRSYKMSCFLLFPKRRRRRWRRLIDKKGLFSKLSLSQFRKPERIISIQ